jgi:S1-C subfamily serine protease
MGQGVRQDLAQSAVWYRRAAEQGYGLAQLKMGFLYYNGEGVPTDYVSSYMWFNLATANSSGHVHANAVKTRDLISGLMTVEQIAEAHRLSRKWKPVKWAKGSPARSPSTSDRGSNGSTTEIASHGTGFFVSQNGLVLTNAHVVEDCHHASVGTGDKKVPARIMARDASNDLALLASDLRSVPQAAIRTSVKLGEDIVVYGFPLSSILASAGNVTIGNVSALSGIRDDSRYLQISAPVQPGNSGGPVLDRQGNVVGIVVGKLNAVAVAAAMNDIPQNVNFAIKSTVIMSFLDAQKARIAEPSASASLSTSELAQRASEFTVQVECRP